MRFMILRKADASTEAGDLPSGELLAAMGQYHEALADAGVLRAGEGLRPSAEGVRVRFTGGKPTVTDGPFAEAKELVAGFSMIEVDSKQAAIDWVRRWPALDADGEAVIEIRETGCAGGLAAVDPSEVVSASPADRPQSGPLKRFMILLKAGAESEAGVAPDAQLLAAMAQRNAEGVKAGVLLAGEGLQSSAKGARVKFAGGKPSVVDGPFAEVKELVAGFWLIQARSMDEALEWVAGYPYPGGAHAEVEIRPLYEAADFGEAFTPELREAEARMREQIGETGRPVGAPA